MISPLPLDEQELIDSVNQLFNQKIESIEFLPIGESSWIYIADQGTHKSVIKIQEEINPASSEVLAELTDKHYPWIPEITLSNAGNMWEQSGKYFYAVQQYIQPNTIYHAGSKPEKFFLFELGKALGDLHRLGPNTISLKDVQIEDFKSPTIDLAYKALARLEQIETTNEFVVVAKKHFETNKDTIERFFNNLEMYGTKLAAQGPKLVITHGDFHFGNFIQPQNDHLYIVDWDQTMLALPEHDLMYFDDDQIVILSEGYGADLLNNKTALQYYRNYLMIRAIWFWVNKVIDAPESDQPGVLNTIIEVFGYDSPYKKRALVELTISG